MISTRSLVNIHYVTELQTFLLAMSNFQMYDTVLLTTVIVVYITCAGLIYNCGFTPSDRLHSFPPPPPPTFVNHGCVRDFLKVGFYFA